MFLERVLAASLIFLDAARFLDGCSGRNLIQVFVTTFDLTARRENG
jgi:hypothetical protein